MSDRLILEFFNREAPQLMFTQESLMNPQTDQLIQAYNLLCGLIFEDLNCDLTDANDRTNDSALKRPILVIRTREMVNLVCNSIFSGSDEFCYTDLLQPIPNRNKHFLTQMIRFYNFKCDIAKKVMNLESEIDTQSRIVELERDFAKKSEANLLREKEHLGVLQEKRQKLENSETQLQQNMAVARTKVNAEKKNCGAVQERLAGFQAKIEELGKKSNELEESLKRMDLNVVNSPERILSEVDNLESARLKWQQKLESSEQENRKLEIELTEVAVVKQSIDVILQEFRALETLQYKFPVMRRDEDSAIHKVNDLEKRKNLLRTQLEQIGITALTERSNIKDKIVLARKEVEAIEREVDNILSDERELAKRLFNVKEEIRRHHSKNEQLERLFVSATEKYDAAIKRRIGDIDFMRKKTDDQQEVLGKILSKGMGKC